jgi:hypothetical protein
MKATISITDSQGRATTTDRNTQSATLATAQSALTAHIALLRAISDVGTTKHVVPAETAAVNAAEAGSNVDEAIHLIFQMADASVVNHRVPAPARTAGEYDAVVGGVVDITNAAIVAYAADFLSGGTMYLKPGVLATALLRGYLER